MRQDLLDKPMADALALYHQWDEHTTKAYLTDTERTEVVLDHYHHLRYRKPKPPLVQPRSVHVNSLRWQLVPEFEDVYAVGVGIEVLFRFKCRGSVTRAKVIAACSDYGINVRYV